jgi:hypothetical protein
MNVARRNYALTLFLAIVLVAPVLSAYAQAPVILGADQLEKVVPPSFYFEGQLGPTQMRNTSAVRFGEKQNLVAALVDTSGYASNIRSKYEGFIISDIRIQVTMSSSSAGRVASASSENLPAGAYGFGFTEDGKMNIFDVGGKKLLTATSHKDDKIQSPRPLMITVVEGNRVRLYRGRSYVELAPAGPAAK